MIKQETDVLQDIIKIKEEVDHLSANNYNKSTCFNEKMTDDLANIKEEFYFSATDDCKEINVELLKTVKHEVEDKKCLLPLQMFPNDLLQPAEELIIPDMLTANPSSQIDSKMCNTNHLFSGNCSRSASCIEITKQKSHDVPLHSKLSICKNIKEIFENDSKIFSEERKSESTEAKSKLRLLTVNSKTPDSPKPTICQIFDGGSKQFNNSRPYKNLESQSVDLNIEINRNECSDKPELICFNSKNANDNLQLLGNKTDSLEGTDGLPNLDHDSNDDGDTNRGYESDCIGKEITDENLLKSNNRKYLETPSSVEPNKYNTNFSCKLCNKKFGKKYKLKWHEESKCGSIKLFGCNICAKGFTYKDSLLAHMMYSHSRREATFKCNLCNKVYSSKNCLVRHKHNHNFSQNVQNLPQTCEYSQKMFASKIHLKHHVERMHVSSEQFECAHCSKVFKSKQDITLHMQCKHLQSQAKCAFSSDEKLRDHLKSVNCRSKRLISKQSGKYLRDELSLTNQKSLECQTCGNCFKTKNNLDQHLVTHSDVPTFQESASESTAAKAMSRRSTVCSKSPDNPKPKVHHQLFNVERKWFSESSPSQILKSLLVDLNTEVNRNECSVESGLICFNSKKANDSLPLLSDITDSLEETDGLSNLNDDCGETNRALECDSNKTVTGDNTFETEGRKEMQPSSSVDPGIPNVNNSNVVKKINREYIFRCKLCNRKFDRKCKLKMHEESKCGSIKLFRCSICAKGFKSKDSLLGHMMNTHHMESGETSTFKCDLCNKAYRSKNSLVQHKHYHHFSKLPQTCDYCQKKFASKNHLRDHVKRIHLSSRVFECAHCSKVFNYRYGIILHMQSNHIPGQKKCTLCHRFFSCEDDLQNHLKADCCPGTRKRFICDKCGKTFKEKTTLTNHLFTHTDEKSFICQTCGKCFKTESNLYQHAATHSDLRPFTCDVCSKSFRIRNHLRQHMSVHGLVNTVVKQRYRNKKKLNGIKN